MGSMGAFTPILPRGTGALPHSPASMVHEILVSSSQRQETFNSIFFILQPIIFSNVAVLPVTL